MSTAISKVKFTLGLRPVRWGWMLYLVGDKYVGGSIENYGEYSPVEVQLINKVLRPGWTVLDIGANMGSLTVPMAQAVGPEGKVLAFEPQAILARIILANLVINDITNAEVRWAGVGAKAEEVHMPVFQYDHLNNYGTVQCHGHEVGDLVEIVTVDSLELPACNFMKVDVEGMELEVLQGAAATISKYRPLMLVENDKEGKGRELVEYIRGIDYIPYWFITPLVIEDNFYEKKEDVFNNQASFNLLCTPKEAKAKMTGLFEAQPDDDNGKCPPERLILKVGS